MKRVLFIMIGATVLLVCATTTATSAPDEPDKLVIPVYRLPGVAGQARSAGLQIARYDRTSS